MENSFIPQAIEIVSKAIEADNAGEYEKSLSLYRDALGRFTMGLKYEKWPLVALKYAKIKRRKQE